MRTATRLFLLITALVLAPAALFAQNVEVLDIQADPNDAWPLTTTL